MVPLPSSLKRRLPSLATVIPTGRPQTLPSGVTKPVTKSSYSPRALPGGMIERYPHNFVPGAFLPVPRAVKRGKNVAFVVSRELLTSVKAQVERGGVRMHMHIG